MNLDEVAKKFHQVNISHNEHKAYYQKIDDFAFEKLQTEGFANVASTDVTLSNYRQRCIDTDTIWLAHVYPRTPVGFFMLAAPTFEELLTALDKVKP